MNKKSPNYFTSARKTFSKEIHSLSNLSKKINQKKYNEICELILNCKGNTVLMGIGKSGSIAAKTSSTLSSTGTSSFFLNAAEASHGDLGSLKKNDVLIIFSFSGETEEIIKIFSACKLKVKKIISLTGDEESTIAKESDLNLHLEISDEACPLNLAPTTSSTAMLLIGDAIAISILEARNFSSEDFAKNHPGGKLGKSLFKAKDLMIKDPLIPMVSENSLLKDVIYEISHKGLGLTLVKNNKNKVTGIFTDGDLRRILNKKINIEKIQFKNHVTKKFQSIDEDLLVKKAITMMNEKKIYSLVVKNKRKKVVGILRMHDIVEAKVI